MTYELAKKLLVKYFDESIISVWKNYVQNVSKILGMTSIGAKNVYKKKVVSFIKGIKKNTKEKQINGDLIIMKELKKLGEMLVVNFVKWLWMLTEEIVLVVVKLKKSFYQLTTQMEGAVNIEKKLGHLISIHGLEQTIIQQVSKLFATTVTWQKRFMGNVLTN